ncbi:hypothetical protein Dsin_029092 [Dipteronia sinensis]|uniref:Uncharacterized protein n=1 Tax=Dipteronia sinensis TaxID=43782 RepID=A0AAD9ZTE9_9ROSI|nr:hypothetical protein Dsin_029092 [Dipteronia sinensis]
MFVRGLMSQLGAAPELSLLWKILLNVFKLWSLMIFVSRVFCTLGATREAMVASLKNWIEFLSKMNGLSSLSIQKASFLPPSISDHCPSVVKLGLPSNKKNCPIKYFNFLTDREDFLPLVESVWQEQVHGTMQFKLCSKLRNLKKALKTLNNDNVGDVATKLIEAKAALDACQLLLDI